MIIPTAKRLGTVQEYYFSKKLREIQGMKEQGHDILNLGIGNPDLPPSDATIQRLQASASNTSHHGYQSYKGIPELRTTMAEWYQKTYHVSLDPQSELLPLMGSKEGIFHISMAFLNPGDVVLVPDPGYPTYTSVANLVQADVRSYPVRAELPMGIDFEALEELPLYDVKVMWVNFPHMPTGKNASKACFQRLIELARTYEFLIVNDNPYSMVLNDEPQSILSVPGAKEVALELNSLSKSHNMAGWRVGWLSGDQAYIDTVLKVKSNLDSGMFLPVQHAAIEALNNSDEWHASRNSTYAARKALVHQMFDLLGCTYEEEQVGMFVWAKLPETANDEALVDALLQKAHVFITPGFIFGAGGRGYLRASLCSSKQTLEEAIRRIQNFVQS